MGAAVQPSPPLLLAFCASKGVSVLPIVVKGEKNVLAARGALPRPLASPARDDKKPPWQLVVDEDYAKR